LILGIGTRYAAVLVFLFVVVVTAIAHRHWEYPAGPQQIGQSLAIAASLQLLYSDMVPSGPFVGPI